MSSSIFKALVNRLKHYGGYRLTFAGNVGVRIFCYHGIVEKKQDQLLERNFHTLSDFREHVSILRSWFVIPLKEALPISERLVSAKIPPVVITFDDGYRNNLLAAELLSAAKIPFTVYVSTGPITNGGLLPLAELSLLILQGRREVLSCELGKWDLRSRPSREFAFKEVRYALKKMPTADFQRVFFQIREQYGRDESQDLMRRFAGFDMLSWDEVRWIGANGGEIGSHGVNHEIHHTLQPQAIRMKELIESKGCIEGKLGVQCQGFAFPNGNYCPNSVEELQWAGYTHAVTMERGVVVADHNRFLLPRIAAPDSAAKLFRKYRAPHV